MLPAGTAFGYFSKLYWCVFHDRLEIVTPGGLPAGMRARIWGTGDVPRDRLLFGMFHRKEIVEQIGSGFRSMCQECLDYGVAEPLIEVFDTCVTTTFRRPFVEAEREAGRKGSLSGAETKSAANQDSV